MIDPSHSFVIRFRRPIRLLPSKANDGQHEDFVLPAVLDVGTDANTTARPQNYREDVRLRKGLVRADLRRVRQQAAPSDRETGRAPLNDERFVFYPVGLVTLDMTIREGSRPEAGRREDTGFAPSPLFIAGSNDARTGQTSYPRPKCSRR
jgi:hypothetical protein